MREIKFRAWDISRNRMRQEACELRKTGWSAMELHEDSEEFIWMQFTGLLDKQGKEIYEGDICRQVFDEKETVGEVTIESTRGTVVGGMPIWPHNVEVIGNIYENKGLLKSKK